MFLLLEELEPRIEGFKAGTVIGLIHFKFVSKSYVFVLPLILRCPRLTVANLETRSAQVGAQDLCSTWQYKLLCCLN